MNEKIKCNPVTFGGSTKEGSPYWNFKQKIKEAFNEGLIKEEEIELEIIIYLHDKRIRPGKNDLDNFLKPIIDALEGILFNNENQISSICVKRERVKTKEEEGVRITSKEKGLIKNN